MSFGAGSPGSADGVAIGTGTVIGSGLAVLGVAHLVRPSLFESTVAPAFPRNTRRHVYINGSIETLLGIGLARGATRRLALVGLGGYVAYVAANAVRNR